MKKGDRVKTIVNISDKVEMYTKGKIIEVMPHVNCSTVEFDNGYIASSKNEYLEFIDETMKINIIVEGNGKKYKMIEAKNEETCENCSFFEKNDENQKICDKCYDIEKALNIEDSMFIEIKED